jgi:hypothetical protein
LFITRPLIPARHTLKGTRGQGNCLLEMRRFLYAYL